MTNLVMIDCHDLGRHLGCYGWPTVPSPNLDALAAQGVRFANHFCTAPQCCPSRATLYTGRYAHANGMFGLAHAPFNWRLHPDEMHLARLMQNAGYATVQIGIQHVTDHNEAAVKQLGFDQVRLVETADETASQVEDFLATSGTQPFFLNIGFFDPHRDAQGRYHRAAPDASLGAQIPPYLPQTPEAAGEIAELQGAIGQLDRAVGRVLAALHAKDLLRDTWLIFTTDHGIAMPRAKCTLYDPGLESALIMLAPPFGLVGGRVFHELISNVDMLPTLLELLNIPRPSNLQGYSFAPLLRGDPFTPRQQIFAEKTFHTAYEPQRAVRTTRHKLIWNAEVGIMNVPGDVMRSPIYPQMLDQITAELPPFELYDLAADPQERTDLFAHPDYAQVRADLRQRLMGWMAETGDPLLHGPIASSFYHNAREWLTDDGQ